MSDQADTVAFSTQHRQRLRHDAPAALARRNHGWWTGQVLAGMELLLVSGLSLAALRLWGASPVAMLLVLLAAAWLGILGEIATFLLRPAAVEAEVHAANRDLFVWHAVDALMARRDRLSRDAVRGQASGLGILIDLALGGMATIALLVMVEQSGSDWRGALAADAAARWTLVAIVTLQVLRIAWMGARRALVGDDGSPPRFAAGGRGLGLFVLVFVLLWTGDEGRELLSGLTWTYGLLLALGVLSVPGLWMMHRQTRWLRHYVGRQRQQA